MHLVSERRTAFDAADLDTACCVSWHFVQVDPFIAALSALPAVDVRVHLFTSGRVCSYMCALSVAVCHGSSLFLLVKFGGYICISSPSVRRSFIFLFPRERKAEGYKPNTKPKLQHQLFQMTPHKDVRSDHPNIKILIEADD